MRAVILAFAMASWGLLCPVCFPQANTSRSTAESSATGTSSTEQSAPVVQSLELKETIPLGFPSPRGFTSGIKGDRNGNIFVPLLEFNSDGTVSGTVLLEILPESKTTKTFGSQALPGSDYPNQRIDYFDVDADGTVYGLVYTHEDQKPGDKKPVASQYFIERFNSDGSTDSVVRLDCPPGVDPTGLFFSQLGVFHDGSFILAGTRWTASSGAGPLTAVYSANGKFIRTIRLPDDVLSDLTLKTGHVSSAQRDAEVSAITLGSMVSSPDGNVYLLRDSQPMRLYGIDSAGEVVKHFQPSPPSPGLNVNSVGLAGADSLFLSFAHAPSQNPGEKPISEWLVGVFNTVSGRFDSVYKLPTKELRVPAGGDEHGGLLFIGHTADHNLAVFDYGP